MSPNNIALKVFNLCKNYQLGNYSVPWIRLLSKNLINSSNRKDYVYALKDISFSVEKGEAFGIIGCNGSGKSTLLQIIAGTLKQTTGDVTLNGRVSALLELGSGFNPDFSGIENIYLAGSILGISRQDMLCKISEICDFADIGNFINQPVRTYSTGMLMRVAFAVAVAVDPDILIIDEALSVGDILFQQKCNARLRTLLASGVTLIVVTHDTSFVTNICTRAMWLDKGSIAYLGTADLCVRNYIATMSAKSSKTSEHNQNLTINANHRLEPTHSEFDISNSKRIGDSKIYISNLWISNEALDSKTVFQVGDWCLLILAVSSLINTTHISVGCEIRDRHGQIIFATGLSVIRKLIDNISQGEKRFVRIKFKLDLAPGHYTLDVGCGAGIGKMNTWQKVISAAVLEVQFEPDQDIVHGIVKLPYDIEIVAH